MPVILLVDEVEELFLVATRKDQEKRDHMVTRLIWLAQLGRGAGMFVEACGQHFGSEPGKGATILRAQLSGCMVHRADDRPGRNHPAQPESCRRRPHAVVDSPGDRAHHPLMDHNKARDLAVTRFVASGTNRIEDWEVTGPEMGPVRTMSGVQVHLIFHFRPHEGAETGWDRSWIPLRVAVDPSNGHTDMLR
ncbi:hypothetical protein ACFV0O_30140 [Kitasatospora sp. NPDC059577]|uniref:hypothetical protein n=2 Tax=unclassified Kitasatospora TaxID=2633591 RepID=UPI00368D42F2